MGQSIFNGYGYNQPNQFNQFMQPIQPTQSVQPTQPHNPTSMMDLLDQFNTFKNNYSSQFGSANPRALVNQMLQSGQVSQETFNKAARVADVLRNLIH